MKKILLYLNFFICFTNLIDKVDQNKVIKAIRSLPYFRDVDILKMLVAMTKARKEYSMNDAESAYFAFYWMHQYITFNCSSLYNEYASNDPATIYKEGIGGIKGFAELFNTICGILNVESNIVTGLRKCRTQDRSQLMKIVDYAWNSVLIDDQYYFIFTYPGGGGCSYKNEYSRMLNQEYFGLEYSKEFYRQYYIIDKKWEFWPSNITKEEFSSFVFLMNHFYNWGFKTISPDIQTLRDVEEITIKLTYDAYNSSIIIKNDSFYASWFFEERNWIDIQADNLKISNGSCEFTFKEFVGKGYLYLMYRDPIVKTSAYYLAGYEVYN